MDLEDTLRIIQLCGGSDPLERLARGVWDPLAVKALIYQSLTAPGFGFDDFDLDFGELERFLTEPDFDLESSLPMETS